MRYPSIFMSLPLLALAACGSSDDATTPPGTDISFNGKAESGEAVAISADGKTGNVAIKIPGVDAKIDMPKFNLGDANFDMDGVKLYPGSTVGSMNVNADEQNGKSLSTVRMRFTAPADVAKVRSWYTAQFAEHGVTAQANEKGFAGTTKDGDSFTLSLAPEPGTKTAAEMVLLDRSGA